MNVMTDIVNSTYSAIAT